MWIEGDTIQREFFMIGGFETIDNWSALDCDSSLQLAYGGIRPNGLNRHVHYVGKHVIGLPLALDCQIPVVRLQVDWDVIDAQLPALTPARHPQMEGKFLWAVNINFNFHFAV